MEKGYDTRGIWKKSCPDLSERSATLNVPGSTRISPSHSDKLLLIAMECLGRYLVSRREYLVLLRELWPPSETVGLKVYFNGTPKIKDESL